MTAPSRNVIPSVRHGIIVLILGAIAVTGITVMAADGAHDPASTAPAHAAQASATGTSDQVQIAMGSAAGQWTPTRNQDGDQLAVTVASPDMGVMFDQAVAWKEITRLTGVPAAVLEGGEGAVTVPEGRQAVTRRIAWIDDQGLVHDQGTMRVDEADTVTLYDDTGRHLEPHDPDSLLTRAWHWTSKSCLSRCRTDIPGSDIAWYGKENQPTDVQQNPWHRLIRGYGTIPTGADTLATVYILDIGGYAWPVSAADIQAGRPPHVVDVPHS